MKLVRQFFVITVFCFSTIYVAASDPGATKNLSSLPAAAQSSISAALGRDLPDYHVRTTSTGLEATDSHGALTTHFTAAGVQFTTGTLRWTMTLRGYGYGNAIKTVTKASPQANQNHVEYPRGPLTEWYVNGPVGLEQGFTLTAPPTNRNAQPLTISVAISGDLTALMDGSPTGLKLNDRSGKTILRYAGLTALDADGKELHASLKLQDGELRVQVDDANAHYPLVVDPLVQLAQLSASDAKQSDGFGWSIATSGNTVAVVGLDAPAYVFVKPSTGWANMTQTAELSPSDGVSFGSSIAISGNTVFVGVGRATVGVNADQGAVYVYAEPSGGWTNMTETAQLTASDGQEYDNFGSSVAASGDVLVAGTPYHNAQEGEVYIFVRPQSGWMNSTETAQLNASDGLGDDFFGQSVAIAENTIVAGAIFKGEAYLYLKPSTGWISATENARLTPLHCR